jgi:uncharacterized protein DUF6600
LILKGSFMKSLPLLTSILVLTGLGWVGVLNARADLEVGASVEIHARADFEAPLATCGTWIEVGSYGRCWRPAHITFEWRPYGCGHWEWTDCGWYWCSDEPWAWACYHYGNWVFESNVGWCWVPGIEWAPAWVSWRFGGGFVGWAPLPPHGFFFAHVPAPSLFVFVNAGHFGDPVRPSTLIVNNTRIINQTTVINNMRRETRSFGGSGSERVFVNDGPGLAAIEKASHRTFKTVSMREAARSTPIPAYVSRHFSAPETRQASSKERNATAFHETSRSTIEHRGSAPARAGEYHGGEYHSGQSRAGEYHAGRSSVPEPTAPAGRESRSQHFFGYNRPEPRDGGFGKSRESGSTAERGSRPEHADKGHGHDK